MFTCAITVSLPSIKTDKLLLNTHGSKTLHGGLKLIIQSERFITVPVLDRLNCH